jgi:IS5 family transposase
LQEHIEQVKASLRAKVEHPFHIVKNLFKHRKTRYRGAGQEPGAVVHAVWPGQPGDCRLAAEGA